jgi:hypothetical protein
LGARDKQEKEATVMYEVQNLVYLEALKEEREREMEWQRLQIKQLAQLPRAIPKKKALPLAVCWVDIAAVLSIFSGVAYGLFWYKP